jgi:MFS family permease
MSGPFSAATSKDGNGVARTKILTLNSTRHNFRYSIFLMIVVITMINYIDRGAISYAAESITREYGLHRVAWGAVLGYFGYGYMFGALLGGTFADVWGPKRVWLVAGFAWSFFEGASAFAGDLGLALFGGSALAGFAVIRVLFGFAEGPAYSTINKTMSLWAAPRERGASVSLGLLSAPLGALLTAPASVGLLLLTNNWRAMFLVLAVISVAALVVFLRLFTDRPSDNRRVSQAELVAIRGPESSAGGDLAHDSMDGGLYYGTPRRPVLRLVTAPDWQPGHRARSLCGSGPAVNYTVFAARFPSSHGGGRDRPDEPWQCIKCSPELSLLGCRDRLRARVPRRCNQRNDAFRRQHRGGTGSYTVRLFIRNVRVLVDVPRGSRDNYRRNGRDAPRETGRCWTGSRLKSWRDGRESEGLRVIGG